MVALATPVSKPAPNRVYTRWFEALVDTYARLMEWMPALGNPAASPKAQSESSWLRAGRRFGKAVAAQRLAEEHYQKGWRLSAVGVLTDAAARFSEGRFPPTAVDLLQRIIDDDFSASSLRTVAETCLKHGHSKHLVAAVCLLGMAYEHDRTDTQALELLARAFEKMGLADKAQKVKAVLADIAEEEPTMPVTAYRLPSP